VTEKPGEIRVFCCQAAASKNFAGTQFFHPFGVLFAALENQKKYQKNSRLNWPAAFALRGV
jgi:hypothetical protein